MIPLTNYDSSEVAVRSLQFTQIYTYMTVENPISGQCMSMPEVGLHISIGPWIIDDNFG